MSKFESIRIVRAVSQVMERCGDIPQLVKNITVRLQVCDTIGTAVDYRVAHDFLAMHMPTTQMQLKWLISGARERNDYRALH